VDGTNVLVESEGAELLAACGDAASRVDRLLGVSYSRPAGAFVEMARETAGPLPPEVGVLDASWNRAPAVRKVTVRAAPPDDLGAVGLAFSDLLTDSGEGEAVLVVFDSITALLRYADLESAYRFLHVLTSQVRTADATGVYGLHADSHGEQTERTIECLFADTVETVRSPEG
jgi:hypothetical protein